MKARVEIFTEEVLGATRPGELGGPDPARNLSQAAASRLPAAGDRR